MKLHEYFSVPNRTQSELARAINVDPVLISQWTNGVRQVPAERCLEIELATNRLVTCEELRGDVKWSVIATRCNKKVVMEKLALMDAQAKALTSIFVDDEQ